MRNLILVAKSFVDARLGASEDGQTVIEYALVTAVVSVALIALMAGFGTNVIASAKADIEALV